jgi:NitT/TauT family transport system substrate-binding protein
VTSLSETAVGRDRPRPRTLACRLGVLLAIAGAALGCTSKGNAGAERLVVAAVRQPATSLFYVARESGCFDEEGLQVEERTFELGRDALVLVRDGRADVAIAFETPTLRAAFEDERIRVLTTLHTSTRNTRLIGRPDRGLDDVPDLRGKRIGLAERSNAEFFLELLLRFGGVARSQVTVVNLSPQASVEALANGELDAAVLSDPYAARAERELGTRAPVFQTDLYTEVSLLVTRDDVVGAREPALRRLVSGLACAEQAVRARPDESLRQIAKRFPELDEPGLRAQLARVRRGLGLDHVLLGVLGDESEWLRGSGAVKGRALDLERLLVRDVLERVAPDAVTLLPVRRGGS